MTASSKTIRVGIVGTGFAGKFHVECLHRIYGATVTLAGVTSRRPESRQAFGKAHNIPVFDSIEAMLPAVDLIDVCSPPYAHEAGILAAAAAGKAIICEKPLTGYFGPTGADEKYRGDKDSKQKMLDGSVERMQKIAAAVRKHKV